MEKKDKNLNVPNLRFPEFSGEWERSNLKRFATKITKKNKGNMCSNVLSNSANYGIIPQSDFFDRSIANSDNTDTYYVIEGGDFVYNPRKSTAAPYGPINVYEGTEVGIISPLYLCFKVEWINKKYLYHYFKSNKWHPYMYINGDSGARHDRVSIKDDVFLDMPLFVPSQKEQLKITLLLDAIDKRIETQKKIIEKYESLIRGLITDINKGKTCKCKAVALRDVLIEVHEKNVENYEVCSVSVSQGVINQIDYLGRSFAAKEVLHYNVVNYGDIVYTKSPTGEFPYGIVKRSNLDRPVAVSPLYGVYRPVNDYVGIYLHLYFKSPVNTKNYLHRLIQKGAKNTINITNQHFLDNKILIPENGWLEIIVNAASTIEKMIQIECNALLFLERQKNYLLSKMFI